MNRLLQDLRRRLQLAASRCIVRGVTDDSGVQRVLATLLAGEARELDRVQEYGFSSHPHPLCEGVAVFVGGNRDHGVVVGTDDRRYRHRPLEEGEVALYTSEGDVVELLRGHEIRVRAAGGTIRLESAKVVVDGDLEVGGEVRAAGGVFSDGDIQDLADTVGLSMAEMRALYNGHTHVETGGTTAPPVPPMEGA